MRHSVGWIAVAGLLATACGAPVETEAADPTVELVPTTVSGDQGDVATSDVTLDDQEMSVEMGAHPTDDQPVYDCNEQFTLTLDQVLEFGELPAPSTEQFEVASQFESLGDRDGWVGLSDRWIADRRLLGSVPAALLVGDAMYGGSFPCVLLRQTSMRPVAWELAGQSIDGTAVLAIERCVDQDSVLIDARPVGDQLLIGVFANWEPTSGSCVVDGEATVSIDVPDGLTIVSSQRWPFELGDPSRWFAAEAHPPVVAFDGGFEGITCSATASATEIFVSFSGLPPGVAVALYSNGTFWLDHGDQPARRLASRIEPAFYDRLVEYGADPADYSEISVTDGGYSFFGATPGQTIDFELRIRVPDSPETVVSCGSAAVSVELPAATCEISVLGGQPHILVDDGMSGLGGLVVFRDGSELDLGLQIGGPVDVTAEPGVLHEYAVEITDRMSGRESVRTECGSFTVTAAAGQTEELERARELFQSKIAGPHLYLTVVEVSGNKIDVAMTPSDDGYIFLAPDPPPTEANPITLHDRLLRAVAENRDVSFDIDRWAGVPTRWSIDGVEFQILCLEFDTAPLELRDIPCTPALDLIGYREL